MFVRNGLLVGSIALASLALACGAPPDGVGKDGKGVGGSPNDPGWQPPGANNGPSPDNGNPQPGDDQGEQPPNQPPPTCSTPAPAAVIPEGWMVQDFTTLSVAVPSSAKVLGACDHDPKMCTGVSMQAVIESGSFISANFEAHESLLETDLAARVKSWVTDLSEGDPPSLVDVTNEMFGCDPAMRAHVISADGTVDYFLFAVLHAGHVFDMQCIEGAQQPHTPHDTTMCTQYTGTLTLK